MLSYRTLRALVAIAPFALCAACGSSPTESTATAPAGSQLEVVGGDDQIGVACTLLDEPLTVRLIDASGKPVPNVSVTWGVTRSSGDLPEQGDRTDASGQATATWLLGAGATQTVIVSSGQATSATFTATAAPNSSPPRTCS